MSDCQEDKKPFGSLLVPSARRRRDDGESNGGPSFRQLEPAGRLAPFHRWAAAGCLSVQGGGPDRPTGAVHHTGLVVFAGGRVKANFDRGDRAGGVELADGIGQVGWADRAAPRSSAPSSRTEQ